MQGFRCKHEGEIYRVLVGNIKEGNHLENHGIVGRIKLKLI